MAHGKYLTYAGYLHLDELLSLQREQSGEEGKPEHDEMLFIIIHQVYELWFKQLLHELEFARDRMGADDMPRLLHTMERILTILKVQVHQLDILETMRPLEFLAFRQRLEEASGLQSYQFRELEFILGHKRTDVFDRYPAGSDARRRLESRYGEPSLWASFLRFLHARGYAIPAEDLEREVAAPTEPSAGVRAALIRLYREDPQGARPAVRAVRGSRRGTPGMALPAREDGGAHDRGAARDRPDRRRGLSADVAEPPRVSRPVGDPHGPVMSFAPEDLFREPNALAPHYSRFRVAERLLLTGHSHQAWPDCGFAGTAPGLGGRRPARGREVGGGVRARESGSRRVRRTPRAPAAPGRRGTTRWARTRTNSSSAFSPRCRCARGRDS